MADLPAVDHWRTARPGETPGELTPEFPPASQPEGRSISDLPADMVEAAIRGAAEAYDRSITRQLGQADDGQGTALGPALRRDLAQIPAFRAGVEGALAAALATGDVREEWRVPGIVYVYSSLAEARTYAASPVAFQPARILHRTIHTLSSGHVITSPWVEVSDGG